MDQTKITVKVYKPLMTAFNDKLDKLHIKRDRFLNDMIQSEAKNLATDMEGKSLSPKAKRYIINELGRLDTVPVNIGVDKITANKLNEIIKESNMVRDAFINRLILFLLSPNAFLNTLELPLDVTDPILKPCEPLSTSPLQAIEQVSSDPLFYLRTAVKNLNETGLYLLNFPSPKWVGFSCYLDDFSVPGTEVSDLLKQLFEVEGKKK
ncbi:MAG: hypothetical protein PHG47_02585 [Sulfuricella sp.]|nr:hypothetical protein [Sulfuricella sp.]